MPTELHIVLSPGAILTGFAVLLVWTALVFLGGVLAVVWPERSAVNKSADTERAEAVELPGWRLPPPRTGTFHAPQYHRSDDDTVAIEPAETRR